MKKFPPHSIGCCSVFDKMMRDRNVPLESNAPKRLCYLLRTTKAVGTMINFCPWCGKCLPKDLRREYFATLEAEHGIEPRDARDVPLPEEFKSDAWWRKRGL